MASGHVKDTVLLEHGAAHGLDDHAGRRVRDGGRLLSELLGEEVDTKVAVLAGGSRGRDADDLAGPALEHQDVAQADVVAGDRHSVGGIVATAGAGATGATARDSALRDLDGLTVWVRNTVSHPVELVTDRVTVVVVVVV